MNNDHHIPDSTGGTEQEEPSVHPPPHPGTEARDSLQMRLGFPAVFSPVILTLVAVVASVVWSWWWLAAIPFVWLGSICAQLNLNLADGCFSYVAGGVALIVVRFHAPLGHAILAGVIGGDAFAVAEKILMMKPVPNHKPKP